MEEELRNDIISPCYDCKYASIFDIIDTIFYCRRYGNYKDGKLIIVCPWHTKVED